MCVLTRLIMYIMLLSRERSQLGSRWLVGVTRSSGTAGGRPAHKPENTVIWNIYHVVWRSRSLHHYISLSKILKIKSVDYFKDILTISKIVKLTFWHPILWVYSPLHQIIYIHLYFDICILKALKMGFQNIHINV